MTSPIFAPLAPDPLAVLRAVARMDLSLGIAISQSLGRPVAEDLAELRARGYVREVSSPRHDGTPGHLHTITVQGREALQRQDEQSPSAPVPTLGPRPPLRRETYTGSELRPFTGRAGSMDALKYPSRVGSQLRYPGDDGSEPAREDVQPPRKT
ncbi:hypothetical protein M2282_005236 [Variovorax boronicumulans]|uniref:hypothetical protein n=1 Tax=Variovorax boronicumulans TaxID=436515 RepID=UPI002475B6D0|nr:hypothetical protein [Variovorax boronicumulans]MDH6170066.1 hypothetical protein [Variovorax boronicumulans]